MAIQSSQRHSGAAALAAAVAAADVEAADVEAAAGTKKRRISRRTRMMVLSIIPVAAVALGAVSASVGLIGSRKAPAASPAKQISDLFTAGLAANTQGNAGLAAQDYQKVLSLDPRNKVALYDLGVIQQQAGQAAQAETLYRQALNIDPNYEVALFNLAILRTVPSPQEAVDLYRHAIALNPQDAYSHLNLGFLLVSLGQHQEGSTELKLAIGLDPKLSSRVSPALIATSTPAPAAKK